MSVCQDEGLIHAIAQALAAHGVPPASGAATVQAQCATLCRTLGGEKRWLPKSYRPGRDHAVLRALAAGASVNEAARRAGVPRATAQRIAQRLQRAP